MSCGAGNTARQENRRQDQRLDDLERRLSALESASILLSACKPLVEALAATRLGIDSQRNWVCNYCRQTVPEFGPPRDEPPFRHLDSCPVLRAREILTIPNPHQDPPVGTGGL